MNGIGIHSMRRIARTKGNWRYWSSREKKEEKKKKRRNERGHNDIPYCDFITAQLILFGSESLRIAFRFRGVKTPAANTPNTLDPFPFPSPFRRAAGYALLPLFSRVDTFPAPIIPLPLPLEEKPEKLEGAIESCPRLPSPHGFSTASFFSSSLRPTIVRHACVPFCRARLKGCHPSFPISSLSRSLLLSSAFEALEVRANQSFRNERRRRRFSRLRLFLSVWTVVVVSPLLWARKR